MKLCLCGFFGEDVSKSYFGERNSNNDSSDGNKLTFGKKYNSSLKSTEIPLALDEILRYIFSSCQLSKKLFIESADQKIVNELAKLLQSGESFDLSSYSPHCICDVLLLYMKKIPNGLLDKPGEELIENILNQSTKDHQYNTYYRTTLLLHPVNKQILRSFVHLCFILIDNNFSNEITIPELSAAIAPSIFQTSKLKKNNHALGKEIIQTILSNRKIARFVMYSHQRSIVTLSRDSSEMAIDNETSHDISEAGMDPSGSAMDFYPDTFQYSRHLSNMNLGSGSIKQRRDQRLSLLCRNMSIDKVAFNSVINPNGHDKSIRSYSKAIPLDGDPVLTGVKHSVANVSSQLEKALETLNSISHDEIDDNQLYENGDLITPPTQHSINGRRDNATEIKINNKNLEVINNTWNNRLSQKNFKFIQSENFNLHLLF